MKAMKDVKVKKELLTLLRPLLPLANGVETTSKKAVKAMKGKKTIRKAMMDMKFKKAMESKTTSMKVMKAKRTSKKAMMAKILLAEKANRFPN